MKFFVAILSLVLFSPLTHAATIYVPDDFSSIQDAISASQDGDTIIVRPGTYVENIDFLGKAITVKSDQGADVTVIDGSSPVDPECGSVAAFKSSEGIDSVLDGFTLRTGSGHVVNGLSDKHGGGILCDSSSPTIRNNKIKSNSVSGHGGGIYLRQSDPILEHSILINNEAVYSGGGIACYDDSRPIISFNSIDSNFSYEYPGGSGIYCYFSSPTIEHCTVTGNDSYWGSTISCYYSDAIISHCTITGNGATFGRGGISFSDSSPLITYCNISDNCANSGGISCFNDGSPLITNNSITYNRTLESYGRGGGIYNGCEDATIMNNIISYNIVDAEGGGVYLDNHCNVTNNIITYNEANYGGGIYAKDHCLISDNIISYNVSKHYGSGGGIYADDFCEITNNIISYNMALRGYGGGISSDMSPSIINNVIARNKAADEGGGIYLRFGGNVLNSTVYRNSADNGGGLFCRGIDYCTIVNSILWNNTANTGPEISGDYPYQSRLTVEYSDIRKGWPGNGNIHSNPCFVDPDNNDFHLTLDSPCWNAGYPDTALPDHDPEGDPRTAFGRVDMGADELYHHLYTTGSPVPGEPIDIKVIGRPDRLVTLGVAGDILDSPLQTPCGAYYLRGPIRTFTLGVMPPSGVLANTATVPFHFQSGDQYVIQAFLGNIGVPGSRLTNEVVLIVE